MPLQLGKPRQASLLLVIVGTAILLPFDLSCPPERTSASDGTTERFTEGSVLSVSAFSTTFQVAASRKLKVCSIGRRICGGFTLPFSSPAQTLKAHINHWTGSVTTLWPFQAAGARKKVLTRRECSKHRYKKGGTASKTNISVILWSDVQGSIRSIRSVGLSEGCSEIKGADCPPVELARAFGKRGLQRFGRVTHRPPVQDERGGLRESFLSKGSQEISAHLRLLWIGWGSVRSSWLRP